MNSIDFTSMDAEIGIRILERKKRYLLKTREDTYADIFMNRLKTILMYWPRKCVG
jgi:hypothetical protein